jgi:dTDP-glucose 4,6-dehydratase
MMRKLLVTGGAGFIGANFVHYWREAYPEDLVVVLDKLTYAGNIENLVGLETGDRYHFVQGDIGDYELVTRLLIDQGIDTIVHFAAESHVDRSILGPDLFIESNIIGTHSLLKAARRVWLDSGKPVDHRFHHVSTDEVYGSLCADDPAFTENTPYAPNSPYSASKAGSDHLVRAYHHTYGLNTTVSNCSNNYGPYQFPEKLIPLMLINILGGKPLPVYGEGKNVRDWLYVTEHARAIDVIINNGRSGETYNVGGNSEWTNIDIVHYLCRLMDEKFDERPGLAKRFSQSPPADGKQSASLITFVKDRPGHDLRYAIDMTKIIDELGFESRETFESGIRKTVAWYLDNETWWRRVMDGSYRQWIETQYADR